MNKITLQLYLDEQWHDAAELIVNAPEQGHRGAARLDYVPEYVLAHLNEPTIAGAAISCRYPVDFTSYADDHWPAFVLDLLPGGEGRRRWAERLGIQPGLTGEFELLKHAAANPAGNLRVKEAAASEHRQARTLPTDDGELITQGQHPGFTRNDIINKQEHFIEYAYQQGAAVTGASDVQGEAPKFLLVEDGAGRWHTEGALSDAQVKRRWIVKFPRGKTAADKKVLHNEASYLEVARRFGAEVGAPLQLEGDALFIPRFDRVQQNGLTERIAMESLYAAAGVAEFGMASSHETLCSALMEQVATEDRLATALEYIRRDLLNVVMGNTDNHGRNSALLRDRSGRITLSPLFDFAPMYLDPAGIARVSRWGAERETVGRPDWCAVVAFFEPWLDTVALSAAVMNLELPLSTLADSLRTEGVDDDIIARRQPAIEANLEQLRRYRDGQS